MLNHCYQGTEPVEMKLDVTYAEADKEVEIFLSCGGLPYDPFAQKDDSLGITILKKMGKNLDYHREDVQNRISIRL